MIEKLKKEFKKIERKYLYFFVLPFFILTMLDLMGTYAGVCRAGGTEINMIAIRLANLLGFPLFAIIGTAFNMAGVLAVTYILSTSRRMRWLAIIMASIIIFDIFKTVVLNTNALANIAVGTELPQHAITEEQWVEITEEFDRARFCRLLPWDDVYIQ